MTRADGAGRGAALLCAALVARAAVARAELRDPFVFGPRREAGDTTASGRPELTGIIWDAAAPLAIVDGEPVMVGQTVEGWRLVEINPDHVVLQRGAQRQTLASGDAWPPE